MFGRTGHTDDRRRRVLTEEMVSAADTRSTTVARSTRSPDAAGNAYAEAARHGHQPRVTDLVPRRYLSYALLFGLGGALLGGLEALYRFGIGGAPAGAAFAPLDLGRGGSVAGWFSSLLLAACGAVAVLIYTLRRHKQSDYHGRYRVWLWTALAALGMSVCSTAPLHVFAAERLARWGGWHLPGGLLLYWLVPAALVLGVFAVRLLRDIRGCRLSLAAVTLAIAGYGASVVVPHLGRLGLSLSGTIMLSAGCQMTAHLLLLVGLLLFARYVLLEIEGLLPARATAPSAASPAPAKAGLKIEPPHATPPPPAGRSDLESEAEPARRRREEAEQEQDRFESRHWMDKFRTRSKTSDDDEKKLDDDDDDADGSHRKLSKADRKRLRRLKAQQRDQEV